jgi:hypothetical protein
LKTITVDGVEYVEKTNLGDKSNPYLIVGKPYFIRTATHYYTGKLEWVGRNEIVLTSAAWIADTGRFSEFASGSEAKEVEMYQEDSRVIIGRGAIVDMSERVGPLPSQTK